MPSFRYLGVSKKIIQSEPTDGLWNDGRNDVEQLGMTYEQLEKAMVNKNDQNYKINRLIKMILIIKIIHQK